MLQPVNVPSRCGAELRLYLAAGRSGQCDDFLRTVGRHADFFGGDVCISSFHIQGGHYGRGIVGLDDDSAATGPVHNFKEGGDGGFHYFLDVQGVTGVGHYVYECSRSAGIWSTLYVEMVFHGHRVFLHRVLVFAFDDEERLVRVFQRIGVEGALRHSLIGFGQHQIAAFGYGVLNEAGSTTGIIQCGQRPRHHGSLVASVSQRDAFNDQSRLGGFIVDVEAAHAAFQFDVHRGDIAQYLRCAASGHY